VNNEYGPGKRQRELDKARKQRDKAERRFAKRDQQPRPMEVVRASDLQRGVPSIEEAMRKIEAGPGAPRSAPTMPARLFVGGLSHDTTEQDLRAAFQRLGPVADAVVMVDRETRAPRGFGFVTMQNYKDAPKAIQALDGSELNGRSIAVNVATARNG
jgi:hypothetical protein